MRIGYNSNKRELTLKIKVKTNRPQKIALKVRDSRKPYTYYTDRWATVRGESVFHVRMPQSPKTLVIEIYNKKYGNKAKDRDKTFKLAGMKVVPLEKQLNAFDADDKTTRSFIKFAQQFSENAGILSASNSIYRSDGGDFRIDYVNIIKDRKTGKSLNTPARISRSRGVIEVSKKHFKDYTVPMRIAILFHEYAHFWINVDSTSEMESDLNALIIYLGLGYPRIEAHQAFLEVFKNTPTDLNKRRYKLLSNFINNFENMQWKKKKRA